MGCTVWGSTGLGLPILDLGNHPLDWGSTVLGVSSLGVYSSRATDFGFDHPLAGLGVYSSGGLESGGLQVSGYRFWIWATTHWTGGLQFWGV